MSNRSALLSALLLCAGPTLPSGAGMRTATAFVPPSAVVPSASSSPAIAVQPSSSLSAGGFEWEDPTDQFDQGVENPFKNPEILNAKDGSAGEGEEGMKIDPARLLGPRLQGSNLYFVGMMGSGKSAVGDIVARSEYECRRVLFVVRVEFEYIDVCNGRSAHTFTCLMGDETHVH